MMRKKKTRLYLWEDRLPSGRVSLLAGCSGAGKTTFIFQLCEAWHNREDFLGKPTHGQEGKKIVYVIGDRSKDEAEETMERVDASEDAFVYHALNKRAAVRADFFRVADANTALLIIDAGERLVEGGNLNNFKAVEDLLLEAGEFAEAKRLAIILLVGSPKMKKGEEYLFARERVMGTAAWGRFSSTIFNIVPASPGLTSDPNRMLYISPRNKPSSEHILTLDQNARLIEAPDAKMLTSRMQLLVDLTPGTWYPRAALVSMGEAKQIPERTVDRILAEMKQEGKIEGDNGKYRLNGPLGLLN